MNIKKILTRLALFLAIVGAGNVTATSAVTFDGPTQLCPTPQTCIPQ